MVGVSAILDNGPEDAKGWMPALWEVHLHLCHRVQASQGILCMLLQGLLCMLTVP